MRTSTVPRLVALGLALGLVLGATTSALAAQQPQQPPLRFALAPTTSPVTVVRDVQFGRADTVALRMDVYRPAGDTSVRRPALVFVNRGHGERRASDEFYVAWARAAASRGLVAVLPDHRGGSEVPDAVALLTWLARSGGSVGIDTAAIAVYAGSGNVSTTLPIVADPRSTMVKAAVMYYGAASVTEFRGDLPLLWVRAGLDRPEVNRDIARLAGVAVMQNAPVTLLNHATGYHAFEMRNDDAATRQVMEHTIAWVKAAVAPAHREALRLGLREAAAAGHVLSGRHAQAAEIYRELVASRPTEPTLRLAYGEALLGAGRAAEACAEFDGLRDKGLGYRDLGLPAARACMRKGDADAALAWLRSIPPRFMPADVRDEPVFTPLRERAEFRAIFESR